MMHHLDLNLITEAFIQCAQDVKSVDEMCNACWEFVLELRKGRRSLAHTRENIAEMINAMLLWGSPAIGFIRTV